MSKSWKYKETNHPTLKLADEKKRSRAEQKSLKWKAKEQ